MIDLLIPSRGRPGRLMQTLESVMITVSDSNSVEFYFFVDFNEFDSYRHFEEVGTILSGANGTLSSYWNHLYKFGKGSILFHGSDDILFETDGWDKIVIDHFKKHPESLLYGKDGHQDENCPTHSFTSRSAADKIGYFVPPYFEADFNDVWLREVYKKAGRLFYNPDLMIRHNHVNVNPKLNDDTYEIAKERRKRAAIVWEEKKHLIDEDVKKLLA